MTPRRKVSAGQPVGPGVIDSYGRLSWNPTTLELEKIDTQWKDNRVTIERNGGVLGLELSDGLSAWKRNVRRPDFETLLERARTGQSQGIAVWHTDRLFRQPRDLEKLIDLAESGFVVMSSHGTRDLSNADDRFILRIEVAQAAKSSDDTSRRILRRFEEYRQQGRRTGGRPGFGFPRKADGWKPTEGHGSEDRPQVPAERVERERIALRDAVRDILAGTANHGDIARRWNAEGFVTVEGMEWVGDKIRNTLLRPALAGLIEYEGVLVGRMPGDPIVDEKVFNRLRAMYDGRRQGAPPGRRHLGSGLIVCGLCGKKLAKASTGQPYKDGEKRFQYFCNRQRKGCGKVYADARAVDVELRRFTIARLSDSRHAQAIASARAQVSDRLKELNEEIAEIEGVQDAMVERLARREIRKDAFDRSNRFLLADLEPLRAERDELSGGSVEGPTKALSAEEIAHQWEQADLIGKRALLVQARGMDELRIMPGKKSGKRTFSRDRMKLVPPGTPYGE